jgi:hypothetical protein
MMAGKVADPKRYALFTRRLARIGLMVSLEEL